MFSNLQSHWAEDAGSVGGSDCKTNFEELTDCLDPHATMADSRFDLLTQDSNRPTNRPLTSYSML